LLHTEKRHCHPLALSQPKSAIPCAGQGLFQPRLCRERCRTDDAISAVYDRRAESRQVKQLDEERKIAVNQLKRAVYFHRQVAWQQDRFPNAELVAVPGLVKLVDRKEIEAADWSLTPSRYVGVAPAEEDEDFDFE
jgi:type I restriction enzyme M protein